MGRGVNFLKCHSTATGTGVFLGHEESGRERRNFSLGERKPRSFMNEKKRTPPDRQGGKSDQRERGKIGLFRKKTYTGADLGETGRPSWRRQGELIDKRKAAHLGGGKKKKPVFLVPEKGPTSGFRDVAEKGKPRAAARKKRACSERRQKENDFDRKKKRKKRRSLRRGKVSLYKQEKGGKVIEKWEFRVIRGKRKGMLFEKKKQGPALIQRDPGRSLKTGSRSRKDAESNPFHSGERRAMRGITHLRSK